MKKFRIEFSESQYGHMEIKAESREEAIDAFWNTYDFEFDHSGDLEIDDIDEVGEVQQTIE